MRDLKSMLQEYTNIPGVSGFENQIREKIVENVQNASDELYRDAFGNLVARCGVNNTYKIGIYAHMDEVGMIVSKINSDGTIHFELVGMIDDRILPGSQVTVCTKSKGYVVGVIGNKSKHLQTEDDMGKHFSYRNMVIDVGESSSEEVYAKGIEVGCQVVFSTKCHFFDNGSILAKSLDNRIGCLVLTYLINELSGKLKHTSVYGFFTVQEEIGARGAQSVGSGLGLDMFLALDTCPVLNKTDIKSDDVDLGKGPVIRIFDNLPAFTKGMISHPEIVKRLEKTAEKNNIPYQKDVLYGTYLDSCTAQFTDNGLPGGSVCFPRRYSHTAVEMSCLRDIDHAITLLKEMILSLDQEPIQFRKKYK